MNKISASEAIQFFQDVREAKEHCLCNLRKNPCEILIGVFDLCIDNFDGLDLAERQPQLYSCLMQLYIANKGKPLTNSLEENRSTIRALREIFTMCKEELKSNDCHLYYALLNFMDFLKTNKGKHLYFADVS